MTLDEPGIRHQRRSLRRCLGETRTAPTPRPQRGQPHVDGPLGGPSQYHGLWPWLIITFLERMLSETTRKIFLIVDRLRAHEAKKVEAWAAEHRDRIELFFLPRYAPERNADEYLNNDMKGSINATGLPGSQEGLRPRIQGFMIKLRHLPEHVRQYFQHPCVKYAAGT